MHREIGADQMYPVAFVTAQGVPEHLGRNRRDLPNMAFDALRTWLADSLHVASPVEAVAGHLTSAAKAENGKISIAISPPPSRGDRRSAPPIRSIATETMDRPRPLPALALLWPR